MTSSACKTTVKNLGKSNLTSTFITNCPMMPSGRKPTYGPAEKGSDSNPCTNVNVLCAEGSCQRQGTQFWRYNISAHYQQAHPTLPATALIKEAVSVMISSEDKTPTDFASRKARVLEIAGRIPDVHATAIGVLKSMATQRESTVKLISSDFAVPKRLGKRTAVQPSDLPSSSTDIGSAATPAFSASTPLTAPCPKRRSASHL